MLIRLSGDLRPFSLIHWFDTELPSPWNVLVPMESVGQAPYSAVTPAAGLE